MACLAFVGTHICERQLGRTTSHTQLLQQGTRLRWLGTNDGGKHKASSELVLLASFVVGNLPMMSGVQPFAYLRAMLPQQR
jgi:hypothetical protein